VCGHQGYDSIASLRNKRNRHNYGSVIGVHDKSTQRAQ
jgi:anaerobic glycerol-3-phosphate dehydrogenase